MNTGDSFGYDTTSHYEAKTCPHLKREATNDFQVSKPAQINQTFLK